MNNKVIRNIIIHVSGVFFLVFHGSVWALNWTADYNLDFSEVYSDNINQTSSNKKSAFVTELSPGISVNGTSAVSTFDFNYRMQNTYNAGGDSGLDINNQLQMNTDYEFVRNRLYMDSSSSISQQNVSNRNIASDNISGGEDTTTVSTFRISPYWTPHFENYADGVVRVSYDRVSTDGGTDDFSDTNTYSQNFNLTSGRRFSYISWSLAFNNSRQSNDDSEDVKFQDSSALIRYAVGREFNVFARAGHSNNSFNGDNDGNNNNGVFYTFGGEWEPSHRFRLEAGVGNNSFATMEISPFSRLHWITTYTNNEIGLNTGGNGETWDTELNYRTRRSDWTLSYHEDTRTTQELLLDEQIFTQRDNDGNLINNPDPNGFNTRLPTLTDEVFIEKTADLSVSFRTGKSNLSASIYRTKREFEEGGDEDKVTGISGSWNWAFTSRSSFTLSSGWQKTESDGIDSFSDKRFDISARVTRNIFDRLNGYLDYRFIDQSSDDDNGYSENRASAGLTFQY